MPKPKKFGSNKKQNTVLPRFRTRPKYNIYFKSYLQLLKEKGSYMMPIIDIMLPACATALNVNFQVWQNDNGFKNILQFDVHPIPSTKTVHLSTLEPSIPKEFLIPHLILTTCATTMIHLY